MNKLFLIALCLSLTSCNALYDIMYTISEEFVEKELEEEIEEIAQDALGSYRGCQRNDRDIIVSYAIDF